MDQDWGGEVLLIEHETFQSLINLFPKKIVGEGGGGGGGGGGVKQFFCEHTIVQ
jgi:1,4-dihydroxy-2-naphthoyl-CoA synthase